MDNIRETRSVGLATAVGTTLGIGVVLGYALPWVTFGADDFGDGGDRIKLGDIGALLTIFGRGWMLDLARLGVVLAVVAALAFPRSQRTLQALLVSAGGAAALMLPIYILTQLEGGDSPGAGLILFAVAAGVTAILPWVAVTRPPRPMPATAADAAWQHADR